MCVDSVFQRFIVDVYRLELDLLRFNHFGAQPRPHELFRRHTVIGDEPHRRERRGSKNAHPGQFQFRHTVSVRNTEPPQRRQPVKKNELSEGQSENIDPV